MRHLQFLACKVNNALRLQPPADILQSVIQELVLSRS